MTTIVGVLNEKTIYIGGDSAASHGTIGSGYKIIRNDPKVFKKKNEEDNQEILIGYTTSYRMGQLLKYKLKIPLHSPASLDAFEYMVSHFIEAVRSCFSFYGFSHIKEGVETGGVFLVGYQQRLFIVDTDYQVGEPKDGFIAIGSGSQFALGSLYSTSPGVSKTIYTPRERIILALQASSHYAEGVHPPFVIESI